MGLSREIRQLLQQGHEEALEKLAAADPRALRHLMGRLWDPDPEIRRRAAGAIGQAAASRPGLGVEAIRRLMWALNDESGTNGVHAIPALGQIGRRSPGMLAPYVAALVSMIGDGGIRLELLEALGAVAEADPRLIAAHLDRLTPFVDESRREEREAFQRLVRATGKECGNDE